MMWRSRKALDLHRDSPVRGPQHGRRQVNRGRLQALRRRARRAGPGRAGVLRRRAATRRSAGGPRPTTTCSRSRWRRSAGTATRAATSTTSASGDLCDARRGALPRSGARRRRGRVSPAGRAAPRRAQRALLPDARLPARRRGCTAGGAAARVARPLRVPAGRADPPMAVPDRDERVPRRGVAAAPARAHAGRPCTGRRRRAARARRSWSPPGWSRTRTRATRSATAKRRPGPATSSARAWSWPSWRRFSTCRRASAPCWCCATCSGSRPARSRSRWRRPRRRSTARCSARAARSRSAAGPEPAGTLRSLGDARAARAGAELCRGLGAQRRRGDPRAPRRGRDLRDAAVPEWWQGRDAVPGAFAAAGSLRLRHVDLGPTAKPRSPGTCGIRTGRPTRRRRWRW